jgi:hypothetical protein
VWTTSTATSSTSTSVNAFTTQQSPELSVVQFIDNLAADGSFTGATEISADVTSGFSFAIDKAQLTNGSLSASGLPAIACTYDANFNLIGCTFTTISASVTWTGQGPITRSGSNFHFKSGMFSQTIHSTGTDRAAAATGTVGAFTLGASQLSSADLGIANSGTTTVCIGNSC